MDFDLHIELFSKEVEFFIGSDLYFDYETGIVAALHSYLVRYIECVGGKNYARLIAKDTWRANIIKEYLKKTNEDYSANDIALMSVHHFGLPPVETMSVGSLEKTIRKSMEGNYKDQIYIKLVQGRKCVKCVRYDVATKIEQHDEVRNLIALQVVKAEKHKTDSPAWRRFELEKLFISNVESEGEDKDIHSKPLPELTKDDELYLMVEALFNHFFTRFDFNSLQKDMDEYHTLASGQDFGERYQELNELLYSPNFNWKYYRPRNDERNRDK